ncbi:hypothetical protein F5878DRAFT_713192 [Lentinula raphanica]|uniref:Uncharacterized protein n=1 Tax=Lentinula raphanica TaxID=153919 RepID=A0AA38NZI6_9AGAR|nr:hypothetical protein F5878DRAFT_713192 [Lentinula raphanica]
METDIKELAPGPETRQDIMDQLLNGRLEYWHRLSFFNETDGLKKARRYLSPNFGCHTVNILEEYRKLLQNAYRRSERNYPPTIDDTSFLIHSSLLKSVLQNLVYVASLSKITLVPVQAIYNAKATPKRRYTLGNAPDLYKLTFCSVSILADPPNCDCLAIRRPAMRVGKLTIMVLIKVNGMSGRCYCCMNEQATESTSYLI